MKTYVELVSRLAEGQLGRAYTSTVPQPFRKQNFSKSCTWHIGSSFYAVCTDSWKLV
jgi:hypothetical protein